MELLSYLNTPNKYALPALINKYIVIRVSTMVEMTVVYTHLQSMFANVRDFEKVCEHYLKQKQVLEGTMCMRIIRDQFGQIRPAFTDESAYRNLEFEIIDVNEIDFGIMR